jgi:hypothetical protein
MSEADQNQKLEQNRRSANSWRNTKSWSARPTVPWKSTCFICSAVCFEDWRLAQAGLVWTHFSVQGLTGYGGAIWASRAVVTAKSGFPFSAPNRLRVRAAGGRNLRSGRGQALVWFVFLAYFFRFLFSVLTPSGCPSACIHRCNLALALLELPNPTRVAIVKQAQAVVSKKAVKARRAS